MPPTKPASETLLVEELDPPASGVPAYCSPRVPESSGPPFAFGLPQPQSDAAIRSTLSSERRVENQARENKTAENESVMADSYAHARRTSERPWVAREIRGIVVGDVGSLHAGRFPEGVETDRRRAGREVHADVFKRGENSAAAAAGVTVSAESFGDSAPATTADVLQREIHATSLILVARPGEYVTKPGHVF